MMPADRYAYQKFWLAVDALATGTSDLRKRIEYAVVPALVVLKPEDFSGDEERTEFSSIMESLRRGTTEGWKGSVAASLATMNDSECAEIARKIVNVCLLLRDRDDLE